MLLGIIQSLMIVNILSVTEFGVVGLVTAIAGIAGMTQHLGLASSSTKEISKAKSDQEIFNVFLSSLSIRLIISIPVSIFLFFGAEYLASRYNNSQIILPLKVFGIVTLIQGFQSILNSIISGTQKFKLMFIYQVLIAFVSVLIYFPMVINFKLDGYFYALLTFNLLQTFLLFFLSFRNLKIKFILPSKEDFFSLSKTILKISVVVYVVKMIYTAWQDLPIVYLSSLYTIEVIALFTFAFNLATKLMAISDSVTDVNLPVYSKMATEKMDSFFQDFKENFSILMIGILITGITVSFWSYEILRAVDIFTSALSKILGISVMLGIYDKYFQSLVFLTPLLLSITFYSFVNILKSSIFVPLEKLKNLLFVYFSLILGTGISYLTLEIFSKDISNMAFSLALGSFISFSLSLMLIYKDFKFHILDLNQIVFIVYSVFIVIVLNYFLSLNIFVKLILFFGYIFSIKFIFQINFIGYVFSKLNNVLKLLKLRTL
jgi:hypothetical protein